MSVVPTGYQSSMSVERVEGRLTARHAVLAEGVQVPLCSDADAHEPDDGELVDVLNGLTALPSHLADPSAKDVGSSGEKCRASEIGLTEPVEVGDERDERRLADRRRLEGCRQLGEKEILLGCETLPEHDGWDGVVRLSGDKVGQAFLAWSSGGQRGQPSCPSSQPYSVASGTRTFLDELDGLLPVLEGKRDRHLVRPLVDETDLLAPRAIERACSRQGYVGFRAQG